MVNLSIVIVNWNTKKLLSDCINSITSKKTKVKYEIIVVDNGSTDGSVEMLNELSKKKVLKVIKNTKNEGFSKANNKGIRFASGEYILLLNSDTRVKNDALDNMYQFAMVNPDAGVVAARLLNADGSIQPSCFRLPTIANAIQEHWLGKGKSEYFPDGESPTIVEAAAGAAFMITPSALKKVGMLDEKYFFYFEDLDYCRRVRSVGLKTYYLPSAQFIHYHGSTVRKVYGARDVWKKLVPGSIAYHGLIVHYLLNFVIWSSQKWQKLLKVLS